jgi:DNA polymerase I-like protein with 3'-5' exonuclease and polymerase domains
MSGLFSDAVIAAISGGRRPPAPKGYKLPTVFPSFNKAKRLSFDLESLDPSIAASIGPGWRRNAYIVGFGIALGDKKGSNDFHEYYPLRHKGVENLDAERVFDWLTTELSFYQGEIVGTNLLYDMDGLQYQNVSAPLAKFRDIQWAEALIDENAYSYGLNTLSKKYGGEGKVNDVLKQMYGDHYIERFHEVHPGHARAYGLGDVDEPLRILVQQEKQLRKENLENLFDIESRLLPFLLYMRKQGTRVDLRKAAEMGPLLTKRRDDAIAKIASMSGVAVDYDNFGTPAMMKRIFDKLQIAYPYLLSVEKGSTLKGSEQDGTIVLPGSADYEEARKGYVGEYIAKPAFRKTWLEETLEHPIAELIIEANSAEKARGTFVEGYIGENAIGDRIHCEFHPLRKVDDEDKKAKGTITGRFSAANPNLQNIPTRDPYIGPMCRSMFIADEGMKWWSQDYSQIEYRMLIHFAVINKCKGAEVPQEMYLKNPKTDFHDACAMMMYKAKWDAAVARHLHGEISEKEMKSILKELRKPAKNLNFGMVYGMGVPLLAEKLGETDGNGKPTKRALEIMAEYHNAAPYIKELNDLCVKEAEEKNFITTILNRRGRFPLWQQRFKEKGHVYNKDEDKARPYDEAVEKWGARNVSVVGAHKALNKKLQGSAADLMKLAMVLCWEAGIFCDENDITCNLTIHDELNGSFVPSERGEKSRGEVKEIMESAMEIAVPILTAGNTGANWSEAK